MAQWMSGQRAHCESCNRGVESPAMHRAVRSLYDSHRPLSRRDFLWHFGGGLGGVALASMLANEGLLAAERSEATPGGVAQPPHHLPRAKRVVQMFMAGGASHIDMFDHKPELVRQDGKPWDPGEKVELFQSGLGA